MRVEILIEESPGAWTALDTYGDVPPMVFQINDLNELKDRNASYSQAIQLPMSEKNCRLFGYANIFEARSSAPYAVRGCVVYVDGIEIVDSSFRLELRSIEGDDFKCQIVSNIKGIFEILAASPFEELDGKHTMFLPVVWNLSLMHESMHGENRVNFLMSAVSNEQGIFTAGGEFLPDNTTFPGVQLAAQVYPYLPLHRIVHAIFELKGYDFQIDLSARVNEKPYLVSLPNMVPGPDSFDNLERTFNPPAFTPYYGPPVGGNPNPNNTKFPAPLMTGQVVNSNFHHNEVTPGITLPNPFGELAGSDIDCFRWEANGCYTMRFRFYPIAVGTVSDTSRMSFGLWKRKRIRTVDGGQEHVQVEIITFWNAVYISRPPLRSFLSDEFEVSPGEQVFFTAYLTNVSVADMQANASYTIMTEAVIEREKSRPGPACKIYPALCTGFKNQLEPVQLLYQLYGLILDVDEKNKIVYAKSFESVYDRINTRDYVDWTEKLDAGSVVGKQFRLGSYAQQNRILFKENELDSRQDVGTIPVDNPALTATKDLFTIAAESTRDEMVSIPLDGPRVSVEVSARLLSEEPLRWASMFSGTPVAWQPVWTLADARMHVVREWTSSVLPTPIRLRYTPNHGPENEMKTVAYFASAATAQSIIDEHYAFIRDNILNKVRVLEADFYLTPIDISNLDLMRPVYLDQYGEYFYIQKINNYQARELTKVTLVCLNVG